MKKTLFKLMLPWGLAVFLLMAAGQLARAQGINLVYAEGDTCTMTNYRNCVIAFVNDGLGNLTPVPGSPFGTNGWGPIGGGFLYDAAAGQLLINPEGTFLYADNEGTGTVAVFSINADGSLVYQSRYSPNGPFPAGFAWKDGALSGGLPALIVVNNGAAASGDYACFSVNLATGALTRHGLLSLPSGALPSAAVPFPQEDKFFGVNYMTSQVASYQINQTVGLKQISVSTPPGATNVLGAAVHPTKEALYVGLPNQNQIAVYTFNPAGNLTYSKEIANSGSGVGFFAISADGTRLYSAEPGSGTISVYNTDAPGNPLLLQHVSLKPQSDETVTQPANMALDPTGKFLYVVDRNGGGWLHVLPIAPDGAVSEPNAAVWLGFYISGTSGTPLGVTTLMK